MDSNKDQDQDSKGLFYTAAKKLPINLQRDYAFLFVYIALLDAISSASPRFMSLAYGSYLSERFHFKAVCVALQMGYFLGSRYKPRKNELRRYFTLGPTMLLIAPNLCSLSLNYSDKFGPTFGPIISQIPVYFVILYITFTKIAYYMPPKAWIFLYLYCAFRTFSKITVPIYSKMAPCYVLSILSVVYYALEIIGSYLNYKIIKAKAPPYLRTKKKITHALVLFFTFGIALTHIIGPLQCSWITRAKVSLVLIYSAFSFVFSNRAVCYKFNCKYMA